MMVISAADFIVTPFSFHVWPCFVASRNVLFIYSGSNRMTGDINWAMTMEHAAVSFFLNAGGYAARGRGHAADNGRIGQ
jgi:hypothetical protein